VVGRPGRARTRRSSKAAGLPNRYAKVTIVRSRDFGGVVVLYHLNGQPAKGLKVVS
jgi:hypothetical protein